jgi:hypothetical protein
MSVTKPTLKFPPPDEPLAAVLVLLDAAAPPLPLAAVLAGVELLLLLLPHAASPRASAAVARVTRPTGLILPVT